MCPNVPIGDSWSRNAVVFSVKQNVAGCLSVSILPWKIKPREKERPACRVFKHSMAKEEGVQTEQAPEAHTVDVTPVDGLADALKTMELDR